MSDFVFSAKLEADASGFIRETERSADAYQKVTTALRSNARAQIEFATGINRSGQNAGARASDIAAYGRELDQLRARYNPLFALQQRFTQESELLNRALRVGAISADEYSAAEKRLAASFRQSAAEIKRSGTTVGRASSYYRNTGFIAQQAGLQVGDFAVQVASGTPALRALIQQGTQLVSMFGPWGAVIGAAGAVLGGIVTYLTATGDAADKAETKLWKYADALDAIRERNVSSRLSGLSPVGQILDAGRSDLEQLERQLQDAIVKRDAMIAALNPDLSQGRSPFQSANPDFQKALDAAAATQRDRYQAVSTPEIDAANQQIAELQAAIDDLRVTELGNAFEDLRRSLNPGEAAWAKYR